MPKVEKASVPVIDTTTLCSVCQEPLYGLRVDRFSDGAMAHYICIVNGDYQRRLSENRYGVSYYAAKINQLKETISVLSKELEEVRGDTEVRYVKKYRYTDKYKEECRELKKMYSRLKHQMIAYKRHVENNFINMREFKSKFILKEKGGIVPKGRRGKKGC